MPKLAALAIGAAPTLAGALLLVAGRTWIGVARVLASTPFDLLFVRALSAGRPAHPPIEARP